MRRAFNPTLLALFAATALAVASPPLARADDTVKTVCEQVVGFKSQAPNAFAQLWELIRVKVAPGSVVKTQELAVPPAPESLYPDHAGKIAKAANVIFSLAPPASRAEGLDLPKMAARLDELTEELKSFSGKLRELAETKNVTECIDHATKNKVDFAQLFKLIEERQSLRLIEQIREWQQAKKALKAALPNLSLRWKVIPVTSARMLDFALRYGVAKNIVIMAHATSDGKIVDSEMNMLPLGFFSNLSPVVQTLTIYACHGSSIVKAYELQKKFQEAPSYHREREVFFVQGSHLQGQDDVVPVDAFGITMAGIEEKIRALAAREARQVPVPEREEPKACWAYFPDLKVTKGNLAFLINNRFAGLVSSIESGASFYFPCRFLDRPKNALVIRGINLESQTEIAMTSFRVEIEDPTRKVSAQNLQHFYRQDHSYQSSKVELVIE